MTTYSLALTGAPAGQQQLTATLQLPDNAGLAGAAANAMQTGTPQLCKRADGSQAYFVLDAERSTASKIVLRPLV
jgi:hypothetical protein